MDRTNEEEELVLEETEETAVDSAQEGIGEENSRKSSFSLFQDKTPKILHCRRCKTEMENGTCPSCGFRAYVPMDKEKQKKIRWVLGGVCLAGLLIFYILSQLL